MKRLIERLKRHPDKVFKASIISAVVLGHLLVAIVVAIVIVSKDLTFGELFPGVPVFDSPVRPFASPVDLYLPVVARDFYQDVNGKGVGVHAAYFDADHLRRLRLSYWHNWHWIGDQVSGIDYFATIWEPYDGCRDIPEWAVGVVGYNEPDGQSSVIPYEAAVDWHDNIESCYYGEFPLGTPTPSHNDPGWLDDWIEEFNDLYGRDPYFDFVTANCYGSVSFCQDVLEGPLQIAKDFDVPFMIKEWAYLPCHAGGTARALDEMEMMFAWQETEPRIEWISWFIDSMQCDEWWAFSEECDTSLFEYDTQTLTTLGEGWADLFID